MAGEQVSTAPYWGAPGVADGGGRATRDLYQFIAKMVEEQ